MILRQINRYPRTIQFSGFYKPQSSIFKLCVRYNSKNHKKSKGNENDSDGSNPKNKNQEMTSRDTNEIEGFHVKSKTSLASPAPLENGQIDQYMQKNKKPYIPKLKHERLTYEYPGLPNQDDFTKHSQEGKIKPVNRYTRYIPKIITGVVLLWAGYTIKVWYFTKEEGSDSQELLDPEAFHKFVITHKEQVDNDHFLVELTPKFNHWQYSFYTNYNKKSLWDGDKIWSVEVKQPQIMVVRSYTPLPLYFLKSEYTRSGERKPLLKVINPDNNDYDRGGVMTLYIKRYNDGEVSKFIIDKSIGDEIELRGPHVEYKFPYHPLSKIHERPVFRDLPSKVEPETFVNKLKTVNKLPDYDNLTFYAAGTGIAPVLQVLMSKNPYRGFITVHYSARKPGETGPLERFMFFLEKLDRVKFIPHYDSEKNFIGPKDIQNPHKPNYVSPMRAEKIQQLNDMSPEEALKLRKNILDGDGDSTEKLTDDSESYDNSKIIRYNSALEQARDTSKELKLDSSLSLVCGPDGYVDFVAGPLLKATGEQGEVAGLLGKKGWDNNNTYKLSN